MWHHGLPVVGRENDRESVQPVALPPILAIGVENLAGDFRIGEIRPAHREPRDVARHQRGLELGQRLRQRLLDRLERSPFGHALGVDGLGLGLLGRLAREHHDAGTDLAAGGDARRGLAQQRGQRARSALHRDDGLCHGVLLHERRGIPMVHALAHVAAINP